MMKIYLVRHGESEANSKGIHQSQKIDTPLSELGLKQAQEIAKRLKDKDFGVIYSSDLKRAFETAKEIAKFHKVKIIKDKRLREKSDEEEIGEVGKRVKSFMNDLKKHTEDILVVAHGMTNRVFLAISKGDRKKGSELAGILVQPNACLNILEMKEDKYKIHTIDCIKHLK